MIVNCPGCGTKLSVDDDSIGLLLACPKCDHRFTVPPADQQVGFAEPVDDGGLDGFFGSPSNPYQQPASSSLGIPSSDAGLALGLSPAEVKKVEAIISDARMVAVAVLLCLLCSGCGFILIGPWYLARLSQWNGWANRCPGLIHPGAEYGSLPQRFQGAKTRLIVGLVIGAIMLVLVAIVIGGGFFARI